MLSVDVGFGNTKAWDGELTTAFPSIYAPFRGESIPAGANAQVIEMEEGKFYVGMTALKMGGSSVFDKRDLFRHKIFILSAICDLVKGDFKGNIAVGLPIGDYAYMRDSISKLKGEYAIKYNGESRSVAIEGLNVFAQAEAMYSFFAKEDKELNEKIVGIVDIGQKTVDCAYFNAGVYIANKSASYELGVINAYQTIAEAVAEKFGFEIEDYAARKYIAKVPDVAKEAFSGMARQIKERLARKHWVFAAMDAVYLVGGGSIYASPYFEEAPLVKLDTKEAVFANAYGFALKTEVENS